MFNISAMVAHNFYSAHLREQLYQFIEKNDSAEMSIMFGIFRRIESERLDCVEPHNKEYKLTLSSEETKVIAMYSRNRFYCWSPEFTFKYGQILRNLFNSQMFICELQTPPELCSSQTTPEQVNLRLRWDNPLEMLNSYTNSLSWIEGLPRRYNY